MTYQDLIDTNEPVTNFYQLLIDNTKDLLIDIDKRNQGLVAKDLNMTQSQLSIIVKMLKELYYARQHN